MSVSSIKFHTSRKMENQTVNLSNGKRCIYTYINISIYTRAHRRWRGKGASGSADSALSHGDYRAVNPPYKPEPLTVLKKKEKNFDFSFSGNLNPYILCIYTYIYIYQYIHAQTGAGAEGELPAAPTLPSVTETTAQ